MKINLPGRVIDVTPLHSGNKGDEIAAWLVENATPETRYIVIDDEEVVLDSQRPFFIWTNPYEGLTKEKGDMSIRILNRQRGRLWGI